MLAESCLVVRCQGDCRVATTAGSQSYLCLGCFLTHLVFQLFRASVDILVLLLWPYLPHTTENTSTKPGWGIHCCGSTQCGFKVCETHLQLLTGMTRYQALAHHFEGLCYKPTCIILGEHNGRINDRLINPETQKEQKQTESGRSFEEMYLGRSLWKARGCLRFPKDESLGSEIFCGSMTPGRDPVMADQSWTVENWMIILPWRKNLEWTQWWR